MFIHKILVRVTLKFIPSVNFLGPKVPLIIHLLYKVITHQIKFYLLNFNFLILLIVILVVLSNFKLDLMVVLDFNLFLHPF